MDEPNIERGNYIREKRQALGLSQEELAGRLDMSSKSISNWENGKTMKHENIVKLAEALQVPTECIYLGKDVEIQDPEVKLLFDHVVKEMYTIEDRGLIAMELGIIAFGISYIALAWSWWAASNRTTLYAILYFVLFAFGVWFIIGGKSALRKLTQRVKERREKK